MPAGAKKIITGALPNARSLRVYLKKGNKEVWNKRIRQELDAQIYATTPLIIETSALYRVGN
jgi:hypothetical protein